MVLYVFVRLNINFLYRFYFIFKMIFIQWVLFIWDSMTLVKTENKMDFENVKQGNIMT